MADLAGPPGAESGWRAAVSSSISLKVSRLVGMQGNHFLEQFVWASGVAPGRDSQHQESGDVSTTMLCVPLYCTLRFLQMPSMILYSRCECFALIMLRGHTGTLHQGLDTFNSAPTFNRTENLMNLRAAPSRDRWEVLAKLGNVGALVITFAILGAPYYKQSLIGPHVGT